MKNKGLIIATIAFFLIVNTNYYWEGKLGLLAFPAFALLLVIFIILGIILIIQLYRAFKENFKHKNRLITIGFLIIVLTLTFINPNGLVDFNKIEGNDLLVAQREGVANCMTTLTLKNNSKFRERSVCFGVTEIKGTYEIRNDTIYFENIELGRHENEYFEYAVIEASSWYKKEGYCIVRYKNHNDTIGSELLIVKNEIGKLN